MSRSIELIETAPAASACEAFAREVGEGFSRQPKSLSSAWFYDDRGSRLFEEITRLEEYYLTRCEREILAASAGDIAAHLGEEPLRVIEIGVGDGHKTEILLDQFVTSGLDFEYVPIDICRRSVVDLVAKLRTSMQSGAFGVRGIVAEYHDALQLLEAHEPMRNLVLFLGSSIGNFTHAQSRRFLCGLRRSLAPGDLALLGFDLKKDLTTLQRAYDDSHGVTREFNFNLLDRINRELGGRFDRRRFQHHACYNVAQSCMESWLVSRRQQTVPIAALDRSFTFNAWEGIQLERSHKYDAALIDSLATATGFAVQAEFTDARGYFVDSLWRAVPHGTATS